MALTQVLERVGELLPAQGPLTAFVHHNPLHAFEHLPFEQAVLEARRLYGAEPFLDEAHYREALAKGRIAQRDIKAVIGEALGAAAREPIVGEVTRHVLWRAVLVHGLPEARGHALAWLLRETPALTRYRADAAGAVEEGRAARLWATCCQAVARVPSPPAPAPPSPGWHRERLLEVCGVDVEAWIQPLLIRFVGAYLDQGVAQTGLPGRSEGLYACFLTLYGRPLTRLGDAWSGRLVREIAAERAAEPGALASLQRSLHALGVAAPQWEAFLLHEALALRGWAGMVQQMERRPDRMPSRAQPASLVDYLAVRLLVLRAALAYAAQHHAAYTRPLAALLDTLPPPPAEPAPTTEERAWPVFQAAQLCGLSPATLAAAPVDAIATLERALAALDGLERRRLLHRAYERGPRRAFYDALAGHTPRREPSVPAVQAWFCIDEREESLRRHLEEADPAIETFGVPGFFGVAMLFRGATDAHPRSLCPVSITPDRHVREVPLHPVPERRGWARLRARFTAGVDEQLHVGSRTLIRGSVIMAALGVLAIIPLVLRILFPKLASRLFGRRRPRSLRVTRLQLEAAPNEPPPPDGAWGFGVAEMADIVEGQLTRIGAVGRLAPLVLVLGHASSSLNNPHEAAHDCGACGGGRGGPNARAFAAMANDPRVRAELAARGVDVSADTFFVGGERNTAHNGVTLFDEDLVPAGHAARLARAKAALKIARTREALERCRRFVHGPARGPRAALRHVEARAADLAQPRPEYGHATNAFCVVGRRSRTRGLFLDRRAFLVSYDPTGDPEGAVLEPLLAAVVPVVAGINLEYYFGAVDPVRYGAGTKLPHNIAGLLGVMDGPESDLRTGLPWQMLEIHEPLRLTVVVEARPEVLQARLARLPGVAQLMAHDWLAIACLDPASGALWELGTDAPRTYRADPAPRVATADSLAFCQGQRGPLPFVRLGTTERENA